MIERGMVLLDYHRHAAIVVSVGHKLTHLIEYAGERELVIHALDDDAVRERGYFEINYPVRRAVRVFLRHPAGVSVKARAELRAIAKGA